MNAYGQDHEKIEELCINTIRTLSMDAIQKANSGHPGAPMGLAPAGYVLWTRVLKHNPANPDWFDRDRFILSGGHASMLIYSLLYLTGYDLSLDDLKNFRQWRSRTPGHPEYGHTPGVETTTGPLGQGLANAVGMAAAERRLAARFNTPEFKAVDHFTYVFCGDGDMMEGVAAEAVSLAGHLGLGKLVCLYDSNAISIEGSTSITFTEDVAARFEACGWHVIGVGDGNDTDAVENAVNIAKGEETRPSLVVLKTHIAYGSPNKQDSAAAHGAPLGEDEIRLTKENLNWPREPAFHVPEEALAIFRNCAEKGRELEAAWQAGYEDFRKREPEPAAEFERAVKGELPGDWDALIPDFKADDGPMATRAASGKVLNAIAKKTPCLMGGSADLEPSNKTFIEGEAEFQKDSPQGRNIRFGVREHAMAAIASGLALHGGIRPYCGTFLVFADYMRASVRLAALMQLPVIYVFTHDSVAVGEDGPTHQPVEHVASLRAIPGLTVIRPADASETAEAWRTAVKSRGPVALILSRQKLPVIDREKYAASDGLAAGAYVLTDSDGKPDVILTATGSEVALALKAKAELEREGLKIRVVSMPCWELFEQTDAEYREEVLPSDVKAKVAIEAGIPMGWEKYVGDSGIIIAIDRFGASAPGGVVMEKYGFSVESVVERIKSKLNR